MRALPKGIRSDVRTCNRSPSICAFRTMCCSACSDPTRRTRSLARRRQRKTSRGVPVGAEFFCRPAAAIPDAPGKPPRRSRGKPRTFVHSQNMRQAGARRFPGAKCTVFVLGASGVSPLLPLSVTRRGRRAPLVARAGTGWRARRPSHDARRRRRRRPTVCCRGPGAAPAARLTTSIRRNEG